MKSPVATKQKLSPVPFAKRMATIVFDASIPKRNGRTANIGSDFGLSVADGATYTKLSKHFLPAGETFVSKSARDIANIMPLAVFMDALPRLTKARAITVTFWEHTVASPKFWRKVKSF